ncbi:uncharacterized protein LOC143229869 [Tachypleus tridentatus]|uniref:uncharacterized protein LOC143229869 n=1 Tax=Tachypleus tridentatus TaxID=6853 RepID=UPI003FD4A0B0
MSTTIKASQRSHLSRIAVPKQNIISKQESEPKSTKTSFTSSVSSNYKPLVTKTVRNSSLKQPSSNKVLVSKAVTPASHSSLSSNLSRPVVSSVTTKSQQPIQSSSSRSSSFSQQFRTQKRDFGHSQSKGKSILVLPVPTAKRITQDGYQQEIQRLATLCEARTKELGWLKLQLKRVTLGFDSFSVLIKYLTNELDAFSNPWLVNELHTTRKDLDNTKSQLKRYQGEVEDLKRCHREEITVLKEKLVQVHKKEIKRLVLRNEQELEELKTEYETKMVNLIEYHAKAAKDTQDNHSCELLKLKKEHDQFVEELENKFTDQLKATIQSREETVAYLQQQLESLEREKETMEEALSQDSESKLQWIINQKADLKKEVDSLKLVLEMRKTEIQDLRKENLTMKKDAS